MHMGGRVTLYLDLDYLDVLGKTLLVTGSHAMRLLANEMSVRALLGL